MSGEPSSRLPRHIVFWFFFHILACQPIEWMEVIMWKRIRAALLILLLPRLVTWAADALELLGEDEGFLDALDPWQRVHVHEASGSAARAWDCMEYVYGRGQRVENLPCPE